MVTMFVEPLVAVGLGGLVAVGAGLLPVPLPPQAASRKSTPRTSIKNQTRVLSGIVEMVLVVA